MFFIAIVIFAVLGLFGALFISQNIEVANQQNPISPGEPVVKLPQEASEKAESTEPVDYQIETVVENLFVPWSIVFTSPERMLVTERSGAIREVVNNQLSESPLITFPEVSAQEEEGLMGLSLDPEYATNKNLYACFAYVNEGNLVDKVVKLKDNGNTISLVETIIDNIPAARFHAGCRLRFGPDDKLYITTGDATDKNIAQDLNSLGGKILRINSDGSIPDDNPFNNSAVWSYGHRNPQGIDWHPVHGSLWSTEHGPSRFDGPPGGDEVNLIRRGENYGWPEVSHENSKEGLVDPKLLFTPAEAPGSGMFYAGTVFPQFTNNFFFGALRGEGIMRIVISDNDPTEIVSYEKLDGINVGRIREIAEGPDGFIYFTSSNRDGRASTNPGDDKIFRLVPME